MTNVCTVRGVSCLAELVLNCLRFFPFRDGACKSRRANQRAKHRASARRRAFVHMRVIYTYAFGGAVYRGSTIFEVRYDESEAIA